MGQYELNEGLARRLPQKGEVRNPTGKTNIAKRVRSREIRLALLAKLDEPCGVPGYEHMTKFDFGIDGLIDLFMDGERWAVKEVLNRVFGRVPLDIEITQPAVDISVMTDDELLARVEVLREGLRAMALAPAQPSLPAATGVPTPVTDDADDVDVNADSNGQG
jgi:hypothetical protein